MKAPRVLIVAFAVVALLAGFATIAGADGAADPNDNFPHPEWVRPDGSMDRSKMPTTVPCMKNDGTRGQMRNRLLDAPPAPGTPEHDEAVRRSNELRGLDGVRSQRGREGETLILEDTPAVRAFLDKYNPCR